MPASAGGKPGHLGRWQAIFQTKNMTVQEAQAELTIVSFKESELWSKLDAEKDACDKKVNAIKAESNAKQEVISAEWGPLYVRRQQLEAFLSLVTK